MVSLVTAGLLVGLLSVVTAFRVPDMESLTSLIYVKADDNLDRNIIEAELDDFFENMDLDDDDRVNVTEFVQSWTALTRQSADLARAYFLLLDGDDDDFIDDRDVKAASVLFDFDGNGLVDEFEFFEEFQTFFYRAPFLVLMELVEDDDLLLDDLEFETIFSPFTTLSNGSVSRTDFHTGWLKFNFGDDDMAADCIFDSFDRDLDDVITRAEVAAKFVDLDLDHDGLLGLREIVVLGDVVPHVKLLP